MSQTICKIGDYCTGHDGFPQRKAITGSGTVFFQNKGMHRVGDLWETHCNDDECHDGYLSTGSASVFVNGKSLGKTGDLISCGSKVAENGGSVFSN